MSVHVYVFLLVVCLLLCPTLLWRLDWFALRPSSSSGGTKRTTLQRLLKPRCPDDCPACRLGSTPWLGGEPAPVPVRPWCEVKSRRGAPKRSTHRATPVPTESAPTSVLPTLTSTPWLEMASMVIASGSKPFAVRPAAPPSVLGATLPCTA